MSPRFRGVPFFVYPVRDMARSRSFYSGVLGMRECAAWEDKWVEFEVGPAPCAVIALSTVMEGAQPGARGGAAALETDDFEGAVAHLKSAGVPFLFEPADTGVCRFARFADPDGNPLVLHRKHVSE